MIAKFFARNPRVEARRRQLRLICLQSFSELSFFVDLTSAISVAKWLNKSSQWKLLQLHTDLIASRPKLSFHKLSCYSQEYWPKALLSFFPGSFCDRQSDCKDQDLCCVREPAINPAISICKPALDEHQTCGPYNQYRTMYIGGTVQPACGPCKQGLTCKQVG